MKKIYTSLMVMMSLFTFGQSGTVFDDLSMTSEILGMDRKYAVYLPPDYETSQRDYPVLYLLHGAGDDQTGWVQKGEIKPIMDKALSEGKSTAMIVVMPDAQTGQRGYFNSPDGAWRYEDFFFEEFMPFIESNYRIRAEKRYRAIAGLSMGGGGTFRYAMQRPDLFDSACPLSASTGPVRLEDVDRYFARRGVSDASVVEKEKYFNERSVVAQIENGDVEKLRSVQWYIDCGDDDFLYEGNALVHIAMREKEVPHEYRVRDGGHNWKYWRESLVDVLLFISRRFNWENN
ncbi:MAG TPA: alpha/beta hydrolase family protein [Membranihabitans sp.]|nr:alpha/beta hydrolase family protein [Membranihabitans sp.]